MKSTVAYYNAYVQRIRFSLITSKSNISNNDDSCIIAKKRRLRRMKRANLFALTILLVASTVFTADALFVNAMSEDTVAAPGNREPNYIVASVTDANGGPVTGLTASNFKVDAMIVGPGGALVDITRVVGGRLPGFYQIDVVPIKAETWKRGVYLFGISVQNGRDNGQAMASVTMD
jgi:hypothetical protein